MIFWSSDRKSNGSFEDTTTASVLAASKWTIGLFDIKMAFKGRKLAKGASTRQKRRQTQTLEPDAPR
jgi:hypothetical protein